MEQSSFPAVVIESLTRRFDKLVAVDALDLTIERGAFFGLLGSNGAGKSTAIKMLTTLLPPSSGTARVLGFDIVRQPRDVRRAIGYVPQMLSVDGNLTALENLRLSAKLYGLARSERETRIKAAFEFMDLVAFANKLVKTFSGGMIRRLEIAQAMLHRPAMLFLDEPTMGLDPVARQAVWDRLREVRGEFGTSILLTTHDMEEAETLCEKVALMHKGKIVAQGAPADLKQAIGPQASMVDVFVQSTGGAIEQGGTYRDVARIRSTAKRLG
jgi:ABC-2 type transport system ATP-binding protein